MKTKFVFLFFLVLIWGTTSVHGQAWEWVKSSIGTSDELAQSVCSDGSGNVVQCGKYFNDIEIQGTTVSGLSVGYNWFLARYDVNGTLLWAKNALSYGGTYRNIYSITSDALGNTIVVGWYTDSAVVGGTKIFSGGYEDIFVAKFNTDGNLSWVKSGGGSFVDRVYDVACDPQGNIYVAGAYQCPATFGTVTLNASGTPMHQFGMLLCYNADGDIQYGKSIGTIAGGKMTGVTYYNNAIYLSGYNHVVGDDQVYVAKRNVNGDSVWSRGYNFDDDGGWSTTRHIHITANSAGVFVAGHYADSIDFGNGKIYGDNVSSFVVGLSDTGNSQWTLNLEGKTAEVLNIETSNNGIVIGGGFIDTVKIGNENVIGVFDQNTYFPNNTFVIGLNTNGSYAWSKVIVPYQDQFGIGNIISGGIASSGNYVYVSSSFSDNIVLWPWYPSTDGYSNDILLAQIDITANSVSEEIKSDFDVYPNPAVHRFVIGNYSNESMHFKIVNSVGSIIEEGELTEGSKKEFSSLYWSKGLYFIEMKNSKGQTIKKLIIQ